MRNTLTRSLSIALVLILAAVLTPGGTNVSEAKSAKAALWQVAIPSDSNGLNLTGRSEVYDNGYAVFEDQGFRGAVRVGLSSTKVRGDLGYTFTLILEPGTNEAGYDVTIGGVEFDDDSLIITLDDLCQFGQLCSTDPPEDCLACLLNDTHPYSVYDPGYGFALQIGTDEDVENQSVAGGRLFLFFDDYNDPSGLYHRVECSSPRKAVTIQQSGPDEWTIFNGFSGEDTFLTCEEYYMAPVGTGKGKSGRVKYERQTVMTATTLEPFEFEMIWTGQ